MTAIKFSRAVREQVNARVAITGPAGSGKTTLALALATALAGGQLHTTGNGRVAGEAPEGTVAGIDTENDSMALYADKFVFDVMGFSAPYDPRQLVEALKAAKSAGYKVAVTDSLTPFWSGEGGVLDIVDKAGTKMGGNRFAGWKDGTPVQNRLMDTLRGLGMHSVSTMRSKMEYVQENDGGKKSIRKVGMAPIQRDGAEYEFDVILDVDLDHNIVVSKSRFDEIADQVFRKDQVLQLAELLVAAVNSGIAPEKASDEQVASITALGDTLGLSPETLVKGLSHYAGATGWDDLTAAGAKKVIAALENNVRKAQSA